MIQSFIKGFLKTKNFPFDKKDPFEDINHANDLLPTFIDEIDKLIAFKTDFSPLEHEKSVFQNSIRNQVLPNESLMDSLAISNIYDTNLLDDINNRNAKIARFKRLLELNDEQFFTDDILNEFLEEEELKAYQTLHIQINNIDNDLGEIGSILSNLILANEKVWSHFNEALSHNRLPENHCPFCNSNFTDLQILTDSYELQIENLKKYNLLKIEEKQTLFDELKKHNQTIKKSINEFLEVNIQFDESVIGLIRNFPSKLNDINRIKERFFNENFNFSIDILFNYIPYNYSDFDLQRVKLKDFFERVILDHYQFDSDKIKDNGFYSLYFDNNQSKFNLISAESMEHKKLYLKIQHQLFTNERLSFLKSRSAKLQTVLNSLAPINTDIYNIIKNHKAEMIEKIKIPFFVYSGKIMQNYQQGIGIFIDISKTGQKNNVVLRTGKDSDHDVVFHLSSGQMAVVSLAFCLSLNKVYNTNENFKFLAIDDPVKTMDNLNVHSFIELLRNEFTDYQIILSTHDDFISRYMSYKFEKYNMKSSIQNVQNLMLDASMN